MGQGLALGDGAFIKDPVLEWHKWRPILGPHLRVGMSTVISTDEEIY
ncbi:MAG: hypothetical protein KJI72_02365 [Patescibacteria group bacterium]|nr:hypothetical protein [Patescibacteria group bacterium]